MLAWVHPFVGSDPPSIPGRFNWRYETPGEMAVLNQIWTALSPLTNLFTPQQKLLTKTRVGAKVTKKY